MSIWTTFVSQDSQHHTGETFVLLKRDEGYFVHHVVSTVAKAVEFMSGEKRTSVSRSNIIRWMVVCKHQSQLAAERLIKELDEKHEAEEQPGPLDWLAELM